MADEPSPGFSITAAGDGVTFAGLIAVTRIMQPSPVLRYLARAGTSTEPPRLQQKWWSQTDGFVEWRDVPTEVEAG